MYSFHGDKTVTDHFEVLDMNSKTEPVKAGSIKMEGSMTTKSELAPSADADNEGVFVDTTLPPPALPRGRYSFERLCDHAPIPYHYSYSYPLPLLLPQSLSQMSLLSQAPRHRKSSTSSQTMKRASNFLRLPLARERSERELNPTYPRPSLSKTMMVKKSYPRPASS